MFNKVIKANGGSPSHSQKLNVMTSRIKILISDDLTIIRKGIKQILLEEPTIECVDEASSKNETIRKISKDNYNCLLLEIFMPGKKNIDILKRVKEIKPDLPILVLSIYSEEIYGIRAIKAGAHGYLNKNCSSRELIKAIFCVASGKRYITPSMADTLADVLKKNTNYYPHSLLSNREFQVMRMIASGKSVSEIAKEFSLSVKTVSTHRANILRKMKMKNNTQLIKYALKEGIVF